MSRAFARLAFSESVTMTQRRYAGREHSAAQADRSDNDRLTPELMAYVAERDSFFIATASRAGWPHLQHRGGPKGFLRVIDDRTLAFADFAGNRQYLTVGNLAENDRVCLLLLDPAEGRRLKIWGRAAVEDDPVAVAVLAVPGYPARSERAVRIAIEAWDTNCRQHITRRFDADQVAAMVAPLERRIAELEAALAAGGGPATLSHPGPRGVGSGDHLG